ncbi:MAG: hypothetical protein EPO11_09935 [Gammaproteobacteria bacterium]|nr:MAG: hypothetical protein EPO11_09935 [Gammaproteobacteria bacterium]
MGKVNYAMNILPYPGQVVSGDLTWAKEFNEQLLLCLIDVAGHGKRAHAISQNCLHILNKH